jgi:predicted helicase
MLLMNIQEYISEINKEFKTGRATEHSYRGYLQTLIKSIVPEVMVTNEPKRESCGAPDYIITKKEIPTGYIEAKNIGDADLDGKYKHGNKEQFDRYKRSLDNIIFSDYLNFHFYKDGNFVTSVKIGQVVEKISSGSTQLFESEIQAIPENHETFNRLIKDFSHEVTQTIKSSKKLAEMMAGKARMLSDVIEKALIEDEADVNKPDTALQSLLHTFKEHLIHDIKPKEFADIYAQTIAYGMFSARLHDPTLGTFSRQEAAELIPHSNPLLRKLFQYIAGYDLDLRLVWIVDGLAEIFRATDVAALLKNFGKSTQTNDPIIHFYETFLTAYDPALRKARGVWYTPEPVVNFIVRAVDDILKIEFGLKDGLTDISKTKIKTKIFTKATSDQRSKIKEDTIEKEVHKVQILDPATGTGTFLAEVVKHIYKKFEDQQGIWSKYVDEHLIPRLNGFELLMASYAMAHLKLDMLLTETGYKKSKDQRFRIYLTNSLEEYHHDTGTLFANWLSTEANEANHIKRDTPVMVIIGNPPYSGESGNKGEWIMNLMEDYKKEPGGKKKLIERNPKWINDDYMKFIRYGQHFIEKNGSGILAFINPHGFLDNPTFRGMRWNLLKTYDKIYVIDLHGNSKKKETASDGGIDQNVFDIMQGVSINLFIKTGTKKENELGKVYAFDLFGKRDFKYNFLKENKFSTVPYRQISNKAPMYYMVQKDFDKENIYEKGFKVSELFPVNTVGIVTSRDSVLINNKKSDLIKNVESSYAIKINDKLIHRIFYRPFDEKYIYYDVKIVERAREKTMRHFLSGENIGLSLCKQYKTGDNYVHVLISDKMIESSYVSNRTSEITSILPLYIYPGDKAQNTIDDSTKRIPNLNQEIVRQISDKLGLKFTNEKDKDKNKNNKTFAPIDLIDYIYAILHSPKYRKKYKEFLKIDFPFIPYPTDEKIFWQLTGLGEKLRQIHLIDSEFFDTFITKYSSDGDNIITNVRYSDNKVYINDTQFFDNVPEDAWNFYIGGYQPAQKWLKDRKGKALGFDELFHYQKIIAALISTIRIMAEIDQIEIK